MRRKSADDLRRFGFRDTEGRLPFEVFGHGLRVLMGVDVDDFSPPHPDDVNTSVPVGAPVRQRVGRGPANDDRCVVRPPLHPHVLDGEPEVLAEPPQAAEPLAEGLTVVTLAAERMAAAETMVDVGGTVSEEGIEIFLAHPLKVFAAIRLTIV